MVAWDWCDSRCGEATSLGAGGVAWPSEGERRLQGSGERDVGGLSSVVWGSSLIGAVVQGGEMLAWR